ncbi:hypothetical protein QYE76_019095 [Lolium multiflorum]|uniref:CCHC-type domain-containing protein n=1 Tax=Lolium multiflorum TaxID=4521 RepID=A0AAD8VQY1_LOLMU|nr:hypothetical protein QYE76_019095 [Lolium multiflorum]
MKLETAAAVLDEEPLPMYAEDLAENVRGGFDLTCNYVLRCHNNLKEKMDKRFDDLSAQIGALQTIVENLQAPLPAAREPPPAAPPPRDGRVGDHPLPVQPAPQVDDHAGNAAIAAGYAPRQRHHDPRVEALARGGANDRDRFGQAARVHVDDGIGRVKISIPPFSGKCEPEDYLDWEMCVEQIFNAHRYNEEKKMQLAAIEFTGYALLWWNQICRSRHRPTSWQGMKDFMRRRFVPEHYKRNMYIKLQRLSQGNLSVDEYYKEMELLMIRTETAEVPEATMARFFNGLNLEVQDRVEMAVYYNIEDLVHQAERAEQQIRRRQDSATSTWRRSHIEDSGAISRQSPNTRSNSLHKEAPKSGMSRESSNQSSSRIECFTCGGRGHMRRDCPNAKKILLTQDGYISASDEEEDTDATYFEEGEKIMMSGTPWRRVNGRFASPPTHALASAAPSMARFDFSSRARTGGRRMFVCDAINDTRLETNAGIESGRAPVLLKGSGTALPLPTARPTIFTFFFP